MTSSYNGWPASPNPAKIGVVPFEPIPGVKFPGGIKGGDVEVIFTYLVQQLDARVERADLYEPGDDWGYAFRANVNDPNPEDDDMSCHASATAIDYNATRHPNKVKYTWASAQVRTIRQIVDVELSGVIKWLAGYDEMHFEIRGSAAAVKIVADRIRNKGKELFTVAQFDDIMAAIGKVQSDTAAIRSAVLVDISEQRELDSDIPENLAAQQSEIIRTVRALADNAGVTVPPPNP